MFNVGPFEMLVLAAVALIVFGPDKLPQLAKDAARMLRTLRDLAHGARSQLNDELGPEFADFDLRSLNPRTAIRNALLGDEELPNLNPREVISRALRGEDEPERPRPATPTAPSGAVPPAVPSDQNGAAQNGAAQNGAAQDSTAARYDQNASYQDAASARYDPDAT